MKVRHYPDKVLRRRSQPVRRIDESVRNLAEGMLQTMYEAVGVGLAAPQVGESLCLVTVDTSGERADPRVFVNPRILEAKGQVAAEEGCLSLPGIAGKVTRAEWVRVVAYDLDGHRLEFEAEGLPARAFQHELDHLRGVLFIDHLSPAEQMAIRAKLKELENEWDEGSR